VTGKGSWFKRAVKAIIGIDDREKALLQPEGVAVEDHGRIFVADLRAGIVRMFDPQRKQYEELRAHDSDPMVAPVDVAIDGDGRVNVSDAAGARVFVFS
jgi:streptogramin lyase